MRVPTDHPLLALLQAKRERYLSVGRHSEAHGVSAALIIVWRWLGQMPETTTSDWSRLEGPLEPPSGRNGA
jgi:hypothetical protein